MQFWKKYKAKKQLRKAKKELKQKLEKARFINFYGHKIDLSLGKVIRVSCFTNTVTTVDLDFDDEYDTIYCYIVLKYQNFFEKKLFIGKSRSIRDDYALELLDFINSGKFTERLNEYEQLKKEYELL
jgi:hypothetical protein